jgi:hypothetical protein
MKPIILCLTTVRGQIAIPLDKIDHFEENKVENSTYIKTKDGRGVIVDQSLDAILTKIEHLTNIVHPVNDEE